MNPTLVLNQLAEFINKQELPNVRIQQMEQRFCSIEQFNKFKEELSKDEDRKAANTDITKQMR